MQKPEKYTLEFYDYSEIQEYIEKKYAVKTRDYARKWEHSSEWHRKKGHVGKLDPEGKTLGSSQIWFREYQEDPEGAAKEPPYLDFWHWLLDNIEIRREGIIEFSPGGLLENGKGIVEIPDFVKHILSLFRAEFGDSFLIQTSW